MPLPCIQSTIPPSPEDPTLQLTIQQSLQSITEQMGEPITSKTAQQLYQEASDLLNHLSYEPITIISKV